MPTVPLKKIMLVEDEPDIQMIVKMVLENGGFVVEVCGTGMEALQKVLAFSPDLILLDMMMPGMDGITTLKKLRKIPEASELPVIFMTAKVQKKEMEQYKIFGAMDVITKPFDPMLLVSTLKEIWEKGQKGK